ncbi:MAG: guanylate kinase [Betaproteobacteria bacterium]|nr:MAG: guanylate kinase [Betaproteobacteria bacterium]TMH02028.1 MAG: guanylate kinase [Betaproteobacteria bacterium]
MIPPGNLFVVAAPSGGGKTSLTRALLEREKNIRLSVSYTTRPPRPAERDGIDYHFVTLERFMQLKKSGEFTEHAQVHGNWYATSATWLKQQVDSGQDVLLEIDWQGAAQIRKLIPSSVQVFVLPPSLDSLAARLVHRGQDDPATIARRLDSAREEMRHCDQFDYVIINQDFASAVDDLGAIVRASRLRTPQQRVRHESLLAQLI